LQNEELVEKCADLFLGNDAVWIDQIGSGLGKIASSFESAEDLKETKIFSRLVKRP